MTLRRPLVRIGGVDQQLPAGDSITGVGVSAPVMLTAGTLFKVPLSTGYGVPVLLVSGTTTYVPAVLT